MSAQINQDGSLTITAYSLVELLPSVVDASKQGYELDFVNNAGYPQSFGTVTVLTMFKKQKETPTEPSVKEVVKSVKVEGNLKDYFKEEVKPIPLGEVVPPVSTSVQDTAVSTNSEQPVKVDKRRKQV